MPHVHAPIHLCCVRNYDTFLGLSVTIFLALVKDSTDMEIYLSESNFQSFSYSVQQIQSKNGIHLGVSERGSYLFCHFQTHPPFFTLTLPPLYSETTMRLPCICYSQPGRSAYWKKLCPMPMALDSTQDRWHIFSLIWTKLGW